MPEIKKNFEQEHYSLEAPPKLVQIESITVSEVLQQEYKIKSLTEVTLDNNQNGKICLLNNKHSYNVESLAKIRDTIDETKIAVMLDNKFKDKSQSNWTKIYKKVKGIKTLVARFDPQNKVLHIDHHLTDEEVGDTPLNQEFNQTLPASTTPLSVSFLRGLSKNELFTEDTNEDKVITTLDKAWESHQFMMFVDHFDPDSTESSLVMLRANKKNIFHKYYDNQSATTLDADHNGSYKHLNQTPNSREKLVKALSDLKILKIPQTIKALQILENCANKEQLVKDLEENGLKAEAELYVNFEKKLETTEAVAESMSSHYADKGNVLYNVLPGDVEPDMAYLSSILKKIHSKEIGPNGFEYCLIVRDFGKTGDSNFSGLHEYGVWLRTLHDNVNLNNSENLLELVGIAGRSSARGNRNAISFVTKQGITFTLTGNVNILAELNAGSKWRAKNPWGLIKTIEMIFSREKIIHKIEDYIGSRPDSIPRSKNIKGTQQERGVVIDTIGYGEKSGEQRVIKFLIHPIDEAPNKHFTYEVKTAGIMADLLWEDGEQLVLIPELSNIHIKPGFIGAEFEKVAMLANHKQDKMGMPIILNKNKQFNNINTFSKAILEHLDDMKKVPQKALETCGVPVSTDEDYKNEVKNLLKIIPAQLLNGDLSNQIDQLNFNFNQDERVLVNGRTKPKNMFCRGRRVGQTDWESVKQGHHSEDQVALISNFLMINPVEAYQYAQTIDLSNSNVEFLFIRKALLALKYNLETIHDLTIAGKHEDIEIAKHKIYIHREIIKWALSRDKNLDELEQLSLELRKLVFKYQPDLANQDSQLYNYSLDNLN